MSMTDISLFVEELLLSDLSVARKRIGSFVSENQDQLSDEAWLSLSTELIECIVKSVSRGNVDISSEERYWRDFAHRLLERDRQEFGVVSLSNEETIYQLLGMMGKCYVFGIYHGSLVRLPKKISLKLLKNHFGNAFGTLLKSGLSPLVIEIHLPKLYNKKLTPYLNTESHLKIAEFLNRQSGIKGVFNANSI